MKILLISPHTDDVEIGAGGTLVRFLEDGHEIFWVVFSTAEESMPDNMPKDSGKKEFLRVCSDLGLSANNYEVFSFPVRKFHLHRQDVLEYLVKTRRTFRPDLVVCPSLNDYHQDHKVVAEETIRAFKSWSSIICYELPWNHVEFKTQLFVKLEKRHIDAKIKLLHNYESQIVLKRTYFSEEFIYGIAKVRGTQINSEYAEAFEVVRWMI